LAASLWGGAPHRRGFQPGFSPPGLGDVVGIRDVMFCSIFKESFVETIDRFVALCMAVIPFDHFDAESAEVMRIDVKHLSKPKA
jgi:hypothetical protein